MAFRIFRKLQQLLDVDSAGLGDGDVPTYATAASKFTMGAAGAALGHSVTLSGNTAGALAFISTGTWTLAGGANVTLSQAGNAVTISGAAGGGAETQTAISGISASDTLYTSGTVRITGLGAITVGTNTGQRIDLSVAAQSVQPETQTFIAGVSASDTLYTSGNVRLTGVGGGVTVSSNTGQRVDISVAAPVAQSVQTQNVIDLTLSGNTAGALALVSSGTLTLAGGNNITLSQAGNAVTISGAAAGGAQTAISGLSASDTLYTSGTVRITGVGGGITVSSNTGQRIDLSVAAPVAQTNQSGNVYASSNTFGTSSGTYDARSISIAGRGAVSVAASNSGWIISAPVQSTQVETQTFIAGVSASDTLYTSGNVRITGVGGGITVSSNTGQRVDLSVAAPVAATNLSVGVSTGGNTLGDTGVATGSRLVFVGSNGITASQGTAAGATTVTLSGVTQSVQTQGGFVSLGVSTGGNTAGNTQVSTGSRFVLVASGNATASQATVAGASTVTISVGTQTVQTQNLHNVTLSGNTAGAMAQISSGTMTLAGGNNITLSQAGNAVTISAPNLGAGAMSAGMSTEGNTAGNTGVTGTRLVFVGTGPVSLSQTTGAAGATLSINAPGTSSLSGVGTGITITDNGSTISFQVPGFQGGVSNLGNTAGATGMTATRLVLVGSNNISLSQTTGAAGATITINQTGAGGGGGVNAGVSTFGNTAGSTGTVSTGNVVFVGTGPISLSQSTGAAGSAATISINAPATSSLSATGIVSISTNGSTISIGAPDMTVADWQNMHMAQGTLMTGIQAISKTPFYFNDELIGKMTANSFVFRLSAITTATLQSFSAHLGIYTLVNSTSAALLGSLSETYVLSTASSASWSGIRNYVMSGIGTHATLSVLTRGDYVFGMMFSAAASQSMNYSLLGAGSVGGPLGRIIPGVNQASTGTSQGVMPLYGRGSVTVNAMPANIVASDIVNQGTGASMQLHPWIYIRS